MPLQIQSSFQYIGKAICSLSSPTADGHPGYDPFCMIATSIPQTPNQCQFQTLTTVFGVGIAALSVRQRRASSSIFATHRTLANAKIWRPSYEATDIHPG